MNKNTALLAGSVVPDPAFKGVTPLHKREAVVYLSKDDFHSWERYSFGNGAIGGMEISEEHVFLKRTILHQSSYEDGTGQLLRFAPSDGRSEVLLELQHEMIIWFGVEGDTILAISRPFIGNGDQKTHYSVDSGENWTLLRKVDILAEEGILDDNSFYLLSFNRDTKRMNVFVYDIDNNGYTRINIPTDFDLSKIIKDDFVYLLGRSDDGTRIYIFRVNSNREIELSAKLDCEPGTFILEAYKYGDFLSLSIGIRRNADVRRKLLLSHDGGQTWAEEDLPIPYFVSPLDYYKDELGIIYARAGRLLIGQL